MTERFCFCIPESFGDVAAARLSCTGLFGTAANLVMQTARFQHQRAFAFTRPGDAQAQEFARSLVPNGSAIPVRTVTQAFHLEDANTALEQLRTGKLAGAAVLVPRWKANQSVNKCILIRYTIQH